MEGGERGWIFLKDCEVDVDLRNSVEYYSCLSFQSMRMQDLILVGQCAYHIFNRKLKDIAQSYFNNFFITEYMSQFYWFV